MPRPIRFSTRRLLTVSLLAAVPAVSAVHAQDVTTGLEAYFSFDGNLLDTAPVLLGSGSATNALYNGNGSAARFTSAVPETESLIPPFITGLSGDSVFFGGDTADADHLIVPGLTLGGATQSFSINVWALMGEDQAPGNNQEEVLGGNGPTIFSNKPARFLQDDTLTVNGGDARGFAYGVWSDAGDDYGLNASDGTTSKTFGDQDVGFNQWVMHTLVVDRTANRIYRYQDGVLDAAIDDQGDADPTNDVTLDYSIDITGWGSLDSGNALRLGGFPIDTSAVLFDNPDASVGGQISTDGSDTFYGSLDDAAVWAGRALDAATINTIFAAGSQFEKTIADLATGFVLPSDAPDAYYIGGQTPNAAANDANWENGFGLADFVEPGRDANNDNVPDFVGSTTVFVGEGSTETNPIVWNDTTERKAGNFVFAPGDGQGDGRDFDDVTYITMTGGTLTGQGNTNSYIGDGNSLVLEMTGNAKLDHNGGAEEGSELQIANGDGDESVTLIMRGNSEIATGNYNDVMLGDVNDPFAGNRVVDFRRRRNGDLGFTGDVPNDPQRWGDDLHFNEGAATLNVEMNDNSRIIVTDVLYMNDQPFSDSETTVTLNDNAQITVMWDSRIHDEPGTHRGVINLNDNSVFEAAFDHALGDTGTGTQAFLGQTTPASGRDRYEIELNIAGNAIYRAGDRVWIGAGANGFIADPSLEGRGLQPVFDAAGNRKGTHLLGDVTVNLNDNGVIKAGNDNGGFNAVDGTGSDAIVRVGDFFIQMGHGANVVVNIGDESAANQDAGIAENPLMEATRHIFIGSGRRGQAVVNQYAGTVRTLSTAQGSVDQPFALAGNAADTNYRPDRGWLDRGGQIVVGYDTKGEYHLLGGTLAPSTELGIGWQGDIDEDNTGGGNGYVKIDGGTATVGRDVIIGRFREVDNRGTPIATDAAAPQGWLEFVSGELTGRDLRVGDEGFGTFTLTGSDAPAGNIAFTGDLAFGGAFNGAKGGAGVLEVKLDGPTINTIDMVGGAFASGTSDSDVYIWDGELVVSEITVLYEDFRPTDGQVFDLITWEGSITGAFVESLPTADIDGIEWDIVVTTASDSNPLGSVALVASKVYIAGDANGNGQVEQADLDAVLNNWGNTGPGLTWATGDFNNNGQVEQGDLDAVLNNWGSTAAPNFTGFAVPEPATAVALLGLAGLALRRRSA